MSPSGVCYNARLLLAYRLAGQRAGWRVARCWSGRRGITCLGSLVGFTRTVVDSLWSALPRRSSPAGLSARGLAFLLFKYVGRFEPSRSQFLIATSSGIRPASRACSLSARASFIRATRRRLRCSIVLTSRSLRCRRLGAQPNNSLQRTRRQSLRSFLLAAELDIVRRHRTRRMRYLALALALVSVLSACRPGSRPSVTARAARPTSSAENGVIAILVTQVESFPYTRLNIRLTNLSRNTLAFSRPSLPWFGPYSLELSASASNGAALRFASPIADPPARAPVELQPGASLEGTFDLVGALKASRRLSHEARFESNGVIPRNFPTFFSPQALVRASEALSSWLPLRSAWVPSNTSLQRTHRQSLRSFLFAAELDIVRRAECEAASLPLP